jgi:uncharacterized membrane protein
LPRLDKCGVRFLFAKILGRTPILRNFYAHAEKVCAEIGREIFATQREYSLLPFVPQGDLPI